MPSSPTRPWGADRERWYHWGVPSSARPDWWAARSLLREWSWVVVGLELVALGVALAWSAGGARPAAAALAVAVGAGVGLAGRRHGQWVPLLAVLAVTRRRRARGLARAARRGTPVLDAVLPDVEIGSFTDRTRTTFGVLRSGPTWSLTLELVPAGSTDLVGAPAAAGLPPEALPWTVHGRDIVLGEARLVVHQAGGQTDLPAHVRRRRTWLALAVDPRRCPEAVLARGGGVDGALKALTTQAARFAVRSVELGVRALPADADDLRAALALCARTTTGTPGGTAASYAETADSWRCGDVEHATYWVRRAPEGHGVDDLLDALARVPLGSVTVASAVRPADHGEPLQRTLVRVTHAEPDPAPLLAAVVAAAADAGVTLVPLRGHHVPGLRATLPAVVAA